MSAYLQQESDFINRTKTILLQYDDYFKDKGTKNKFEVTLLINAFVGLLILPQQEWFTRLPENLISEEEWGIDVSHIGFIKENEKKTIKAIATHLRNSVAHYNFTAFENKQDEISRIIFKDYLNKDTKTFDATIPVANLRKFLDKFSQVMLEEMKK